MTFSNQMISFFEFILVLILCLLARHQAAFPNSTRLITSVCESTPYPDICLESLNINAASNNNFLDRSLNVAISEGEKLLNLLLSNIHIIETHKGSIQDCKELHQITLSCLQKSLARNKLADDHDKRSFLAAALTNKNTCLEGLESASGPLKPLLVNTIISAYKHVSNCLSLLPWAHTTTKDDKMFHIADEDNNDDNNDDDNYNTLTVATDGTGNFSTINDAINFAPNNSIDRIIIYIKQGVYEENVEIPIYKPNIVLVGEGSDVTIISGNRSVVDGWTTYRSATVAVSGEGFLARDIGFYYVAGPEKHQAVALRINADLTAVYRCVISGYQDTLYVHSFRQFYRECDIYGTIDYIFGNAAVVFQECNIISRKPMPGQFTVISAQSRDSLDQQTGISFQNCSVLATDDLLNTTRVIKSYLGRPWRAYARTVFIESYIDDFINDEGWIHWSDKNDQGLDTLYYGEYYNVGPGSSVVGRVTWPGYHVMDYDEASNFTVSEFITGHEWLDSTSFPYDDGV